MKMLQVAVLCVLFCIGLIPFSADAMEFTVRIGRSAVAYVQDIPVYVKDAPRATRAYATLCDGSEVQFSTAHTVRLRASDCSSNILMDVEPPTCAGAGIREIRERNGATRIKYRNGKSVEIRERRDLFGNKIIVVDYDD